MRALVNEKWWDEKARDYYSVLNLDHRLEGHDLNPSLLYYGIAEDGTKSAAVLKSIVELFAHHEQIGIELQSHLPEILYRYDKSDAAYAQILDLTREDKYRREYPEVSYAVVEAIVTGLVGIEVEAAEPGKAMQNSHYVQGPVVTIPRLTVQTQWAQASHVPIRANEIRVRHDGLKKSVLENTTGPSLIWRACLPGNYPTLLVDDRPLAAEHGQEHGQPLSCAAIPVGSGNIRTVRVPE